MATNYKTGDFKTLYEKAAKNENNKVSDKLEMDVISAFKNDKTGKEKIIRFPLDIDDSIKKNKSLSLFILKDAAYQGMVNAITEGGESFLKTTGKELGDAGNYAIEALASDSKTDALKNIGDAVGTAAAAVPKGVFSAVGTTGTYLAKNLKLDTNNLKSEQYHCIIQLPIPNNLTEDDSHSYEESNGLTDLIKESLPNSLKEGIGKVYNGGDALLQQAAQVSMRAERRKSQQIAQLPVLNPYTWKKFKGSALKVFRFTFFFIPRNKEEAETIMKIVYTLKKYSYGSKSPTQLTQDILSKVEPNSTGQGAANVASDFFISAPPKVLLQFNNPLLNKLINPGVCVIDSIGLTYNEGNTVGMTLDGIPRFIEMNLNLSEYNVRFQEDF